MDAACGGGFLVKDFIFRRRRHGVCGKEFVTVKTLNSYKLSPGDGAKERPNGKGVAGKPTTKGGFIHGKRT